MPTGNISLHTYGAYYYYDRVRSPYDECACRRVVGIYEYNNIALTFARRRERALVITNCYCVLLKS